jgi:plasmid stabilization system protein ParE
MSLQLVFTIAAKADIRHALDWYDRRQVGLGQRFLDDLDSLASRISDNPMQFPTARSVIRRASLRRFPYGMFFLVLPNSIQVIACLHTSRDPVYWQRRHGDGNP